MTMLHQRAEQEKRPAPVLLPSPGLGRWLAESGGSLVFSTYQSARMIFLSGLDNGETIALDRIVGSAMGLAADHKRLWVSNKEQAWRFVNVGPHTLPPDNVPGKPDNDLATPEQADIRYDGVFMPRMGVLLGPCDTHDLLGGVTHNKRSYELLFVNTSFSCIASIDPQHNFVPVWKPSFISALSPEDRCHLNGMGARDGRLAYVTACAATDTPMGWREARIGGGLLIDVQADAVICDGLSMPHSPRWHDGRVWLLNSAEGQFGYVDPADHRFIAVADCPGFARGLCIVGDHAVIGLSKLRANSFGADMPLSSKLEARRIPQRCGLLVVNLKTGAIDHWLTIEGVVTELYDVAFLAGLRRPYSPGFSHPHLHRSLLNIPDQPFPLANPRPAAQSQRGAETSAPL